MSETVYYRGTAKEIVPKGDLTVEEIAKNLCDSKGIKMNDYVKEYYNESWCFLLSDEDYDQYSYIGGKLYYISKEYVDLEEEIIKANKIKEGEFTFELKFYNGGASFNECLEEAINKLK